jgi:hypothetical protein
MKHLITALLSLALLVSSAVSEETLFDIDLTAGSAPGATVSGGAWEDGWRVKSHGNRIVLDAGVKIANGYVEARFTCNKAPWNLGIDKTNWFGLYEEADLTHGGQGDVAYLRQGQTKYGFSRMKASGKGMNSTHDIMEKSFGSTSDWKLDDQTVHTVRFTWKDGVVTYRGTANNGLSCNLASCTGENAIDEIQYAFIGGDRTYGKSVIGTRFLSIKFVDLDDGGHAPVSARADAASAKAVRALSVLRAGRDKIQLAFPGIASSTAAATISIRALDGRLVCRQHAQIAAGITLSTRAIPSGAYMLHVSGAVPTMQQKIVIE